MQLKSQKGSVAFEEVLLSTLLVLSLGGTFAMISTNADQSVQVSQATYSGHQIQQRVGDSRPEFALVPARSRVATNLFETEPIQSEAAEGSSAAPSHAEVEQGRFDILDLLAQDPAFNDT